MMRCVSLLALSAVALANQAHADEIAHIDPERLALGIENLAQAWAIPSVTAAGPTDDVADDQSFELSSPLADDLDMKGLASGSRNPVEPALLGLFANGEIRFVIGEISRRRRIRD
ncbi:MAG: hypothetical protein AAGA73_05965 [Pseudomonadota bacterium]